jgi:hypothetical protein
VIIIASLASIEIYRIIVVEGVRVSLENAWV